MKSNGDLEKMEQFYMALADKTRLRLLNLMRNTEVCVCFFTEVLGESQPKISRHLAYLRNAGIVEARRDGKWMHYSIVWPDEREQREAMESALNWLAGKEELRLEIEQYEKVCCTPELLVQIARTPIDFLDSIPAAEPVPSTAVRGTDYKNEFRLEPTVREPEPEKPPVAQYHNELEEFLL